MVFSEQNNEIAAAIVACWNRVSADTESREVTVTSKKGGNSSYTFSYIDLNAIFKAARDVFNEHGLALMQNAYTENTDAGYTFVAVETTLLHSSGQWAKTHPLKLPVAKTMYELGGNNYISSNMQDFGAQISYLKRYSLYAALGITMERDTPPSSSTSRPSRKVPTTLEEAEQVVVTFGISKGKTLKDVFFTDSNSFDWLEKNARDENIQTGIRFIREAVAAAQANAQSQQQPIDVGEGELPKDAKEAAAIRMDHGPHANKTLKEIYQSDRAYFESYMRNELQHPVYRRAIQLMDEAVRAQQQKQGV